jgi:hypothetical protein
MGEEKGGRWRGRKGRREKKEGKKRRRKGRRMEGRRKEWGNRKRKKSGKRMKGWKVRVYGDEGGREKVVGRLGWWGGGREGGREWERKEEKS